MKKIVVIGCGAAGKTTLSDHLGNALNLQVYHLDKIFWQPGWKEMPKDSWAQVQQDLCQQSEWIMDGNYGGTMKLRFAAADTIIFLDMPTIVCLIGAIKRYLRYRNQVRPDMAEGCREKVSWDYIKWILTYRRRRRPIILERLKVLGQTKMVIILRSRPFIRKFVEELSQQTVENIQKR